MKAAGRLGIPLWVKVAHSVLVAVIGPLWWATYGPLNFLWFSDVALLLCVPALWLESRLLVSMMALAALLPEACWVADFLPRLLGFDTLGLTGYMFDPGVPLYIRGLSLVMHLWLPGVLLWGVWRLGHERRALFVQTGLAWVIVLLSRLFGSPEHNVNFAFGFPEPSHWAAAHPLAYLAAEAAFLPLCVYLPTHLLLARHSPKKDARPPA